MLANITIGLLWIVAIIEGIVIVALIHQVAALRRMANMSGPLMSELPLGSAAPHFSAVDMRTRRLVNSSALNGRRLVLCFVNADCHTCRVLMQELATEPSESLQGLVVYYDGDADVSSASVHTLASKTLVLTKADIDVPTEFHLDKFPVAILIDEAWRIVRVGHPLRAADLLASMAAGAEIARSAEPAIASLAS